MQGCVSESSECRLGFVIAAVESKTEEKAGIAAVSDPNFRIRTCVSKRWISYRLLAESKGRGALSRSRFRFCYTDLFETVNR